jgi:hypothetical protein
VEVEMESSIESSNIAQLRAVLWSMRKVIAAARVEGVGAQALLFELHALADAGVALAESTETRDST